MTKARNIVSAERLQFPWVSKQGSILIVSLWMLTLLSAFAISIGYHVRQKVTLADRIDRRNWLQGIAEAGVEQAVNILIEDSSPGYDLLGESWAKEEDKFRRVAAAGGTFTVSYEHFDSEEGSFNSEEGEWKTRYGIQDEERKININTAKAATLATLFQIVVDLDSDEAQDIAYSIVDWRDSDSFLSDPTHGAETDYYENLDLPYTAKNRPFEVLSELLLVRGMTPDIFEQVRDKITIYGNGAVNVNTATKEVLLALGFDESLTKKMIDYRKGTDREEATADDRAFTQAQAIHSDLAAVDSLSSSEVASISNLSAEGFLTVGSNSFMVRSRGELRQKGQAIDLVSVIDRSGKVQFWSVGVPRRMRPHEIERYDQDSSEKAEGSS
ncbi:MAG: general secretion pathway protein GspK [Candidatus Omnitrophica bacterium]|nr:general secretion pathway protein GspK [Candidatus Omnitrophota bacterium]